ncbi:MAG: N-acetylneuraminate synthase family protein [Patescibacteria group bacterium]|nr:N-acetylneuraminate synthase family protein [Patescibacteria group bacterium]
MSNQIKDIKIAGKTVGLNRPIFISAEVGTTCNGDLRTAKKLVDAAKEAGMDAVKFQILNPEDKFSDKKNVTFSYKRHDGKVITENLYGMLKQYVMPRENWKDLKKYADKAGIIMFATPDYLEGVDLMEELGMPAYKIATWDVTFWPMLEKIAKLKKPTVIDLGASDKEEVAQILKVFEKYKNDKLILLHCFHTQKFEEMNLRTVEYLRQAFGYLSGFSAPGTDSELDYLSLPYGPVYVEKRLTLNRKDPHHHHAQALEPEEMKEYVAIIHNLEKARGWFDLKPTESDLKMRSVHFRGLVARVPIKKGQKLTSKNVACRRPYYRGIDAKYYHLVLNRTSKVDLKENDPINWDAI